MNDNTQSPELPELPDMDDSEDFKEFWNLASEWSDAEWGDEDGYTSTSLASHVQAMMTAYAIAACTPLIAEIERCEKHRNDLSDLIVNLRTEIAAKNHENERLRETLRRLLTWTKTVNRIGPLSYTGDHPIALADAALKGNQS